MKNINKYIDNIKCLLKNFYFHMQALQFYFNRKKITLIFRNISRKVPIINHALNFADGNVQNC